MRDEYTKGDGDYSVTEILNPPQIVQLKRRYTDQIETDVMDNVWSIMGKAAHHILEQHGSDDAITEERMYVSVLDRKIGGQVDNYYQGTITDYKITSAWTLVYGSRLHEWEEQLNLYAYIFRQNGYEVNHLQIVAILRDFDKNKAQQDFKYPQTPIVIIPLNLWSIDKQEAFIYERVGLMKASEGFDAEDLSIGFRCMPDEMWQQEDKYAIMKGENKRATKVFDILADAEVFVEEAKDRAMLSIVKRPGKRTRCESYCSCRDYCHQWEEYCAKEGT